MRPVTPSFVATWFKTCEDLPVAGIATDGAGVVTHWSRFAEGLYGYRADEAIGRSIMDLTVGPIEAETAAEIMRTVGAGTPWEGEFTAQTADGRTVEVHVIDLPIVSGDAMMGILGLSIDVTAQRRDLDAGSERIWHLALLAEAASEEERRDLARMLHDDLGQRITALQSDLHSIADCELDPDIASRVAGMIASTTAMIAGVQEVCSQLRPPLLDYLGVVAAIEFLTDGFAKRTGIVINRVIDADLASANPRICQLVFDIVRESLTNIERHARARTVDVRFEFSDDVKITVVDDGIGIGADAEPGIGISLMTERVKRVGGTFRVGPHGLRGTEVCVRIPQGA